jgi:hypothetical protein
VNVTALGNARVVEWRDGGSIPAIVCDTVDEFVTEIAAVTAIV